MSSNTQFHVSTSELFSLNEVLGSGGSNILCGVLQKLIDCEYSDQMIQKQLPWQSVAGKNRTFYRQIGDFDLELSLECSVPRVTIAGTQLDRNMPESIKQSAHQAVNQLLALAVSDRMAQRLTTFANERNSQLVGQRVSHHVALKALQLQDARSAIRTSCQVLVRS